LKCAGKQLSKRMTGKNNYAWKGGKERFKCMDCGKQLSRCGVKRCLKCSRKPENHPRFKGGLPNCIDCGVKVSRIGVLRCYDCNLLNIKKNKKPKRKFYCLDCKKEVSIKRVKRCRSCSAKKRWKSINYKNKLMKSISLSLKVKINKLEKELYNLLKKILPNEYKFVGNGKIILGGFNPDFINVNGQKKVLEFFGCYWHKCPKCDFGKRLEKDKRRLKTYKSYGYKTLIVWEHELEDLPKLKEKILEFNKK